MVCITIPKDQRTAGRMSTPSYHPIRMIKITFPAPLPLWRHLFWQLRCLHFCTAVRESQSQLTAPFFLPFSASNDCVIEETKCYPNTMSSMLWCHCHPSATHSLSTYTPEVPRLSLAECSKHFIECVFVNTYYFLVLTPMNKALIPFNQYTYLPKIHVLSPYASSHYL